MRQAMSMLGGAAVAGLMLSLGLVEPAAASCPIDSVLAGTVCMDKYEASVWHVPPTQKTLISRIKQGSVTLANLTSPAAVAAGVVQLGLASGDLAAAGCPDTGNGCVDVYPVSVPGVMPARFTTWFQAVAAARNASKRLPSNAEWQAAALGTPDPGASGAGSEDCNTKNGGGAGVDAVVPTGSRSNCVSDIGVFDMVGNVYEWVADWMPRNPDTTCETTGSWGSFSDDAQCLGGAATTGAPGALTRGGSKFDGALAGVFAVSSFNAPSLAGTNLGFRAVR